MDREATNLLVKKFARKYSDILGIKSELLKFIPHFCARAFTTKLGNDNLEV
jgi:hypothetical protein